MPFSKKIQRYIDEGRLTPDRALALGFDARENLESDNIRGLIDNKTLTLEQAIGLTYNQRNILESQIIRDFITDGTFTLERALSLDLKGCLSLETIHITNLIANGTISVDQAVQLDLRAREILKSDTICRLIANQRLTLERAIRLTAFEQTNLESEIIQNLINTEMLTFEQALALDVDGLENLESEHIRDLITDGIFTIEQAITLSYDARTALRHHENQERLRNGELRAEFFLNDPIYRAAPDALTPNHINDSQSTHAVSVHRTSSESAMRLRNRYPTIMEPGVLNTVITAIKTAINELPNDHPQKKTASRCVARLTAPTYRYTDAFTGIQMSQLLALTWFAIHDSPMRIGRLDDAMRQFMNGLCEIQRGYNLSDTGVDFGGDDVAICSSGTFNKLLEKLHGVHPDVIITFVTPKLATLKLPIVVKEESAHYLAAKAAPSTLREFHQFNYEVKNIEDNGVEVIWDAIKTKVSSRMFDEFGSLFAHQDSSAFTHFIEAGKYVELGALPNFQNQISQSEGYWRYCSLTLKSYGIFNQLQCNHSGVKEMIDGPQAKL